MTNRALSRLLRYACQERRKHYTAVSIKTAWRKVLKNAKDYIWLCTRLGIRPACTCGDPKTKVCQLTQFECATDPRVVKGLVPPRKLRAALPPSIRAALSR